MANTLADCLRMNEAARDAGVTLMVGQSRRYYPSVFESKRMLGESVLGGLRCIMANLMGYLPEPPTMWWKSARKAGGLMIPLWGNHIFDYLIWMFDGMPETVYCKADSLNPAWEGEDEVAAILGFAGGRFASVRMSWNTRLEGGAWDGSGKMLSSSDIYYRRYIQCERGTLLLDDETGLFVNGNVVIEGDPVPGNFARQYMEFASSVTEGRIPLTDGQVGARIVAVQQAALMSARTGTVMRLKGEKYA